LHGPFAERTDEHEIALPVERCDYIQQNHANRRQEERNSDFEKDFLILVSENMSEGGIVLLFLFGVGSCA